MVHFYVSAFFEMSMGLTGRAWLQNVQKFYILNSIILPFPIMIKILDSAFGNTYTKTGTIQTILAWSLFKDDVQNAVF